MVTYTAFEITTSDKLDPNELFIHHLLPTLFTGNRRKRFSLHSSNKNEAANLASQIFSFLVGNGWAETIAKYKSHPSDTVKPPHEATVGDLIRVAEKYATVRERTFQTYIKSLRKIVADIMEVPDEKKHQSGNCTGNKEWKESIDATPLSAITPLKVQGWKQTYIKQSGKDASAKRKATVTTNSLIRNAKGFFSKKLLPFLHEELVLPTPLPFEGVRSEKAGSVRYHSKIDAVKLMGQADKELKDKHPQAYTVFLLAFVCGLRVSEIDHLLWESVDLDQGLLHVRSTKYHTLKSEDSEGILDLSDEMCKHLQNRVRKAADDFVIMVDKSAQNASLSKYRCQKHCDVLIKWLRNKGVKAQKPIHTLRKEIGSLVAAEQGIFAASRYLRHSNIQITAAVYLDKKNKVVPSIGIRVCA
ncbi:MAG: site-specific integrase [Verrucomicrobiae bacterium]|nr:site-specific integrase [Verrucomicrobiae bacterium]NNJ42660.1 site-specific integrase [Akkermansiaceae bacterium]